MLGAAYIINGNSYSFRVFALDKSGICVCGCAQVRNSWQESRHRWNRGSLRPGVRVCVLCQLGCDLGSGAGQSRY